MPSRPGADAIPEAARRKDIAGPNVEQNFSSSAMLTIEFATTQRYTDPRKLVLAMVRAR